MALRGLLCESAIMRIAFQSSPIRNFPLSDALYFTALILPLPEINDPLYRKESFFPRFNRRQRARETWRRALTFRYPEASGNRNSDETNTGKPCAPRLCRGL